MSTDYLFTVCLKGKGSPIIQPLQFCEVFALLQQLQQTAFYRSIGSFCQTIGLVLDARSSRLRNSHVPIVPSQSWRQRCIFIRPFWDADVGKERFVRYERWRRPKDKLIRYLEFELFSFGLQFVVELAVTDENSLDFLRVSYVVSDYWQELLSFKDIFDWSIGLD